MTEDDQQCCKRSLLGSLWDSAKKFVKDPVPIPGEVQESRMIVCRGCPSFVDEKCVECGCYMRIKTQFSEMECPLGKWGKHTVE